MSAEETYNGWTNRETWAVALHINNDQGWQESVHEALRNAMDELRHNAERSGASDAELAGLSKSREAAIEAGEIIHEWVDGWLEEAYTDREYINRLTDIGSLWRVNWTELGASFLEDIEED